MKVRVKDHNNLVRDTQTMAILNVDRSALAKDALFREKKKREKEVEGAINKLETDVKEIKECLAKMLAVLENRGP